MSRQPHALRLRRRAVLPLGLVALSPLWGRPVEAAEAGIVSVVRGTVTATQGRQTRALHVGAVINAADLLATGDGARLLITMIDGSTLAMGERSRLLVTAVMAGEGRAGSMVFDLLAGVVRAVLGPDRPDLFAVRGRVAVAAARSTDFVVETDARLTAVFVASGVVAVEEAYGTGTVQLEAGQGVDVRRGQAIGSPVAWGRARIDDILARTAVPG